MSDDKKHYEPLLNIEEVLPILNQIDIFGALNDKELQILFKNLKKVTDRENLSMNSIRPIWNYFLKLY